MLCVVVYIMVEGVVMWQCACLWPEVEGDRLECGVIRCVGVPVYVLSAEPGDGLRQKK